MAKMTLLEIVQNILSATDSDEVNSISDTVESLQVANVVRETYDEQFNNITEPSFKGLIQLEGLSDVIRPNYMRVPDTVGNFEWIRYRDDRNDGRFGVVDYYEPEEFLERQFQYTTSSDNTFLTTDPVSSVQYYIKTNISPRIYTLFDNNYIAFDSYDSDYDTTLHAAKTAAFGAKLQPFLLEDDFIPSLDANLFPLLLAEAKSTSFINFKQITSTKEEQRARRQRVRMQNDQYKSKPAQKRARNSDRNYARTRS